MFKGVYINYLVRNLIAVSKTTHTTHDTEDIVVNGEDRVCEGIGC